MTSTLDARGVRLVLLDIEGTTTPITFVYDVLFPYARGHLRDYLHEGPRIEAARIIAELRREYAAEPSAGLPPWGDHASGDADAAATYAIWLMDRDRKSPALKSLQGLVWGRGYASGALRGEVFDDVPPALLRWQAAGARSAIYSSGSVLAQRLLFSSTRFGDLTPVLSGFFDTAVGAKREESSYREIARQADIDPTSILFVSDVVAELEAADAAGCQTALCVRPGNPSQPAFTGVTIRSFDELI